MALFGDKFKAQWQGNADQAGWKDKIGVLGLGISQLSAGQAPNIMPAWQAVEDRRAKRKMNDAMGNPDFVSGFTPQQQAMLSSMPPEMAQSLIMEKMFAPPKEPVKADWQTFGGDMYNMNDIDPATGKPRMTFDGQSPEQVDAGKRTADRELRRQDGLMLGLKDGSPEMNNYLVTGEQVKGPEWRNATPEEAAAQGAVAGQINDSTGKFEDQPLQSGMSLITNPDGTMTFKQGPGASNTSADGSPKVGPSLAEIRTSVKSATDLIDQIALDPATARVTGSLEGGGGNDVDTFGMGKRAYYGDKGLAVVQKIAQLQNTAWLAARDLLKGGGAITDYESKKAEGAMARLSRAQGDAEFQAALKDLKDAIVDGSAKLEAAQNKGATPPDTAATVPQYKDDAAYLKAMGLE